MPQTRGIVKKGSAACAPTRQPFQVMKPEHSGRALAYVWRPPSKVQPLEHHSTKVVQQQPEDATRKSSDPAKQHRQPHYSKESRGLYRYMTSFPHWPMSPTAKLLPAHFFEQAPRQNMQARRAHTYTQRRRTQ